MGVLIFIVVVVVLFFLFIAFAPDEFHEGMSDFAQTAVLQTKADKLLEELKVANSNEEKLRIINLIKREFPVDKLAKEYRIAKENSDAAKEVLRELEASEKRPSIKQIFHEGSTNLKADAARSKLGTAKFITEKIASVERLVLASAKTIDRPLSKTEIDKISEIEQYLKEIT